MLFWVPNALCLCWQWLQCAGWLPGQQVVLTGKSQKQQGVYAQPQSLKRSASVYQVVDWVCKLQDPASLTLSCQRRLGKARHIWAGQACTQAPQWRVLAPAVMGTRCSSQAPGRMLGWVVAAAALRCSHREGGVKSSGQDLASHSYPSSGEAHSLVPAVAADLAVLSDLAVCAWPATQSWAIGAPAKLKIKPLWQLSSCLSPRDSACFQHWGLQPMLHFSSQSCLHESTLNLCLCSACSSPSFPNTQDWDSGFLGLHTAF